MKRFNNKVAIITGAASGIGREVARQLVLEGAKVLLVDIDSQALENTLADIGPKGALHCVSDVSNVNDVKNYAQEALKRLGKIDFFFNNAGIEGRSRPISDYPDEVFNKVIDTNLKGVWYGCKYVLPIMKEGGSMVITSSVAGVKGFQGLGPYVASKHGIVGIMRTAALECAKNYIRVNTVHPGPVETGMMRRIESDISPVDGTLAKREFEDSIPFGRYASVGEIAALVLFLASDASKYITGGTFFIDGGMALA